MTWVIAGTMIATTAYGTNQAGEASDDALAAQQQGTDQQIALAERQYSDARQDTRVGREVGDSALAALGMLMGIRRPPSQNGVNSARDRVNSLESEYEEAKKRRHEYPDGSAQAHWWESKMEQIKGKMDAARVDLRRVQSEYRMASQFSGGQTDENGLFAVPDINALSEGVDMPKIDDFLSGVGKGLVESDFYQFQLKQGRDALDNFLSSRGTAYGGNAMRAAIEYGQDYASSKGMELYNVKREEAIDQYKMNLDRYNLQSTQRQQNINTLMGLAGQGQQATAMNLNAGQNYTTQVGNAVGRMTDATSNAAYYEGATNINAANQLANTGMTLWMYNDMTRRNSEQPRPGS